MQIQLNYLYGKYKLNYHNSKRNFVRLKLLNNPKANIVYNFIDNKTLRITHIKQIEKGV